MIKPKTKLCVRCNVVYICNETSRIYHTTCKRKYKYDVYKKDVD